MKQYIVEIGEGYLRLDKRGTFSTEVRSEATRLTAREARLLIWALTPTCDNLRRTKA